MTPDDGAEEDVTVAACQFAHAEGPEDALARAERAVGEAHDRGARLALLPEYWFARPNGHGDDDHRGLVERLSKAVPGVVVAGNELHPIDGSDGVRNVCVLAQQGRVLGAQAKLRPTDREADGGVVPGDDIRPIDTPAGRVAVLVCADILYPALVAQAAAVEADLLLVPVMSRARFGDATRRARRDIFVARAFDTATVVVKAGGYTRDGRIAGRSLIAAPGGLLAMAPRPFEDATVVAEVDRDRLDGFRATHRGFTSGHEP